MLPPNPDDADLDDPAEPLAGEDAPGSSALATAHDLLPTLALERSGERSLEVADPLRRYLAEIGRFALLSAEEERDLAVRIRDYGDARAAYRLATGNLRLVVHIAMDFRRTAVNLLDLIQEGNLGLLQAVQRFDPYRGVRFSAYAGWWIRAYILKYLIDHWSLVRVGTTNTRRRLLFNLRREKEALEAQGIRPEPGLLARRLGVPESEVLEVERGMMRDVSLDAPLSDDTGTHFADLLHSPAAPIDEALAEEEFQTALREKMEAFGEQLEPRDRDIFRSRLLADSPATLQEIGERHGISREAVRQREQRVLERLKDYLRRELEGFREIRIERDEPAPGPLPEPPRKRKPAARRR